MVVTNPDGSAYQGMSMFLVPTDTPGVNIVRNVGLMGETRGHEGNHALIHYENVRVPAENLLGGEGQAFAIAQTRLGGGRIHHAMRTIAQVRRAFDMMCERALSRQVRKSGTGRAPGSAVETVPLATLAMTQEKIADSWIEIEQFRLLVLRTAWLIDKHQDYRKVRKDIAAVKAAMPKVFFDVVQRAGRLVLHLRRRLVGQARVAEAPPRAGDELVGAVEPVPGVDLVAPPRLAAAQAGPDVVAAGDRSGGRRPEAEAVGGTRRPP